MRDLKELLPLVIEQLKSNFSVTGICSCVNRLVINKVITARERLIIEGHLNANKPSSKIHTEFTESKHWLGNIYYWYIIGAEPETRQIRIDFLTKLLNELK